MGVKNRIYCHLPSYKPSLQELEAHIAQPGPDGGMEATRIDLQKEINELLAPQADDFLKMRNSTMEVTAD
eukprot:5401100-Pyramimonas_sp.AAC.1